MAYNIVGGGGSQPTLRDLYPDDQGYQLAVQARRLQNQRNVYQALGITPDQVGQPKGFLQGVLDIATRPQSAALGFLTGIAGLSRSGEETNPLLRAASALTGRTRYQGSDFLRPNAANASPLERLTRGAVGFGIDVVTDPLTYLTFGGGGVLRGASRAIAAGTAVEKAAPKILNIAAPTRIAPTATSVGTATEAALERARGSIDLIAGRTAQPITAAQRPTSLLTQPTAVEAAATAPRVAAPALEQAAPVVAQTPDLAARLGEIAGREMALGGPRAVLSGIRKELEAAGYTTAQARQAADRILAATPSEIRGGIGVAVPFTKARATVSTAKFVEDAPALKAIADTSRKIFNTYRSGPVYQKWASMMNGKVMGPAYAAVLRGAETGTDKPLAWNDFLKLNAIDRQSKAFAMNMGEENSALIRATESVTKDKETQKWFDYYYDKRDRMQLSPNAGAKEQAGFEAANNLYTFHQAQYQEAAEIAQRLGVDLGNLSDYGYMARPFTEEGRQWFRNRGYNPNDEYDPAKVRQAFIELQDGELRALSNKEINERVGIKIFEDNPLKLAQHTMSYTVNLLSNLRFLDNLASAGLAQKLEKGTRQFVNVPAFQRQRLAVAEQIDNVLTRLRTELMDPALKMRPTRYAQVNKAIEKLSTEKNVITETLSSIDSSNPEDLKKVGELVSVIKRAVAAGDAVKVDTSKIRQLEDVTGLVRNLTAFEDISALRTQGVVPLVSGELVEKGRVRMPRGFSEFGASEEVRNAVQRLYTMDSRKGIAEYENFIDKVYMPYYQLFKTHATITRGPGYHIRNLTGGLLNNNLAGITVADHAMASKIDRIMFTSTRKASKALDNIMAGKPSGLTGEQDALAQALADTLRKRGAAPSDLEADQLGKIIGLTELQNIKVGKYTAADILVSATDNNVLRGNRTLEALRTDRGAESQMALSERLRDPNYINIFEGKSREELTKAQNILNWTMNNRWVSLQGDVAEHSENFLRLAGFINGAGKYGLEDGGFAASMIPKATQFDYSELSSFERRILKNIVPFYTWMRNNVPLQINALFSQPGKFNRLIYAQNALQTTFGAPGDQEGMSAFVPPYMRAKFGVLTNIGEGMGIPTVVGLETPASDLNQLLAWGGPGAQWNAAAGQIVRAVNPLAKSAVESLTGRDLLYGTEISGFGAQSKKAARNLIPFLGTAQDVIVEPAGFAAGKALGMDINTDQPLAANLARNVLGLPVSGFTPAQQYSAMRNQEQLVRGVIKQRMEPGFVDRLMGAQAVDQAWLQSMLDAGFSPEQIRQAVAQGQGRPIA